jgi:ParB family chromosome partitioning protein
MQPDDVLVDVDLDLLEPNPDQPRSQFHDGRLEELAASIKVNGIVQPLLVRRRGERYQIIAGERRWRAAQLAAIQKVPVVVREIPDDRVLELSLVENIQRQELNPIEEAHAYRRLIDGLGLTQEDVARRVGRDRSSVTNYLRLLKLPRDIQTWVEEDRLSMGHARALLSLESPQAQRDLASDVINRGLSVREVERQIRRLQQARTPQGRSESRTDVNVRAAEEKLQRKLRTRVRIRKTARGGRIEIQFYSDAELDSIYQMLMSLK